MQHTSGAGEACAASGGPAPPKEACVPTDTTFTHGELTHDGLARGEATSAQAKPIASARALGLLVVLVGGPAAALAARFALGMGLVESAAVLFLVSGWLGLRLLRRPA
jgi:hypothetical protein